jgi:GT2 family glycosyltransferase
VYNRQQSRVKTVTIAIPSLHRPDLTARCIEFIQRQTLPADEWDVVVIENEAQPGSILADPLPPNTRRIELSANEGTTGSLEPDCLERLVGALDADPKLGFATGKLLRATQRTHFDGAGDAMLLGGAAYRLGHFDRDDGQYDRPASILSGCGAAVLYRREIFELGGPLDEDFLAYLEDVDLALRAQLLGYTGLYLPDAVAYHIGSATLGDVLRPKIVEYLTRNQIYLIAKDYPRAVFRRLLPRIAVYQALWLIYAIRNCAFSAWLRGWWAGLRGWGMMRRKQSDLTARRRITDAEFLVRLRESERQIYDWQHSQAPDERSGLLKIYFRLFGRP